MPDRMASGPNGLMIDATSQVSVSVRNLDIEYRVYEELNIGTDGERRRHMRSRRSTTVQAVKNVSFDILIGEAVGIVGSNGSGKSTLLRSIAGLQSRSSGTVLVRGEAHLLGIGAALKPPLSGYRNVVLGGLAMGMDRAAIEAQMESIASFSGLGDALTRPMKTYSSGMRARLAFSIATLRVPEVLLIDEALAVGDRKFRQKSLRRINEIREQAKTVVMVTHNLGEIRQTCSRAIWLEGGRVVADGPVAEILESYEQRGS